MKVLYDHQMFLIQKYGGITKYFCELIQHLGENTPFELSLLFSENQHLKDNHDFFKKKNIPLTFQSSRLTGYVKEYSYKLNQYHSEQVLKKNNYDLFHPTFYDTYFLKYLKRPFIITVHDLIEFKFRDQYKKYSRIDDMSHIIKRADRIIAISNNTKQDLLDTFKIKPQKIDVVYHGYKKPKRATLPNKYGRYLLFVGARTGYKNFTNLSKAFAQIKDKDPDLKLLCTGQPLLKDELEFLKKIDILNNVIHLSVNETVLNTLYANALCFVYPTQYEGFGMPVLEAFANNCPVCLSNTSSLPEVAGNAGFYFDPGDIESLKDAIQKVIYQEENRVRMIEKGKKRLELFSWQKCADQTILSYEKLLA